MQKKIKILHVIPRYVIGGAEKLVYHYANLLDKNKYEIHVASCVEDGELREQFEKLSDVHVYVGSKSKAGGRVATYRKLWRYAKEIKPDIIHTHLLSADFFGFLSKLIWKNKILWITTQHNLEENTSALRKIFWRIILKKADRVIVVSKSVEKFSLENFKIKKSKCTLLLNGIDTKNWSQISMNKLFTHQKIQIACVGRFWEQKGHVYLLEALSKITSFDYELHLFGDGPLKEFLIKKSKAFDVYEKIIWHGAIPNLADYLADIDIVVQPSLWEGLSLVIMEMMSAGRPIVATEPAGRELLQDKVTGLVVPAKDSNKLAQEISYVVGNQKEAILFAKKAREFANKNFDISKNVLGLQNIYKDLIEN